MNKCIIGFGAAVLATSLFGVESEVVGYANKTINKDIWQCMPVQFQDCASDGRTIPVAKYLNVTDMTPGYIDEGDFVGAPQIQLPNENTAANYTKYFYVNNAWDGSKYVTGWVGEDESIVTDENVLTLGKAFWFRGKNDGATATGSGKVLAGDTATITVKPEVWQMVSCPFPVPGDLATVITEGITPGYIDEGDFVGAPQLQIPNENTAANYTKYFYVNNAWDGSKYVTGWVGEDESFGGTIPVSRGAWYKGATGGTITFQKSAK